MACGGGDGRGSGTTVQLKYAESTVCSERFKVDPWHHRERDVTQFDAAQTDVLCQLTLAFSNPLSPTLFSGLPIIRYLQFLIRLYAGSRCRGWHQAHYQEMPGSAPVPPRSVTN